ncbi:MAG: kelch repeat-containing protein [Polyangiales bacterium]
MYRRLCLATTVALGAAACRGESQSTTSTAPATAEGAIAIEVSTPKGLAIYEQAHLRHPLLTTPDVDHVVQGPRGLVALVDAPRFKEQQASVYMPATAAGALVVQSAGVQVTVTPRGFADVGVEWAERLAVYPDVSPGVHAFRRPAYDGVEDFYQVTTPRDALSFTYDVALEGVAGLRLVGNTLELLDSGGAPRLRSTTPVAIDSNGVRRSGEIVVSGCAYDTDPRGPWGRPVTKPGASSCTVTMRIDGRGLAYPVLVDPAWIATFNTKQQHGYHKMFLLSAGVDAGKVLIAGGTGSAPNSTELFDPGTNTWANAGLLPDASGLGQGSNGVQLADGRIVMAGGFPASGATTVARSTTFWRGLDGVWVVGASMSGGRAWHTMNVVTVAGRQRVLVAGGQPQSSLSTTILPSKSSESYVPFVTGDPTSDNWIPVGNMSITRTHGGSAVLSDGRVVVAGGDTQSTICCTYLAATSITDIWDPATSTWSAGPTMGVARAYPTVVALPASTTWQVVVGGGFNSTGFTLNSLEVLNRASAAFSAVTPTFSSGREWATGTLLTDGKVLFVGGNNAITSSGMTATDTTDLYDPVANTVTPSALMATPRMQHAAAALGAKGVLVTGGLTTGSAGSETSLSELYDTTIGAACTTTCPAGLTCTEGVCCTAASCPTGQTCKAPGHEGVCTKPKGAACTINTECATGFCVSGFCCESNCLTGCKACNIAGSEGTCVLAAVNTDPSKFCAAGVTDAACARKCDGTGKCQATYPSGNPCGASLVDGGTPFCTTNTCSGFGSCSVVANNCGLTCTTSVTCDETTKSCSASASGVKAGFCVIDSTCWTYGDPNPKNACEFCNPPVSKVAWSLTDACRDGGVEDTGTDSGTDAKADTAKPDTGKADTGKADTGTAADAVADTSVADTSVDEDTGTPPDTSLPSQSACSCETPGQAGTSLPALGSVSLLAIGAALLRRRRARALGQSRTA